MNTSEVFTATMEGYTATLTQTMNTQYSDFNPLEIPFDSLGFDRYYNAL